MPGPRGLPGAGGQPGATGDTGPAAEIRTELFAGSVTFADTMAFIVNDDGDSIVCPETGEIEIYARAIGGNRKGAITFIRMPAADLYNIGTIIGANPDGDDLTMLALSLGHNRAIAIGVQDTDHYIAVASFDSGGEGEYTMRITEVEYYVPPTPPFFYVGWTQAAPAIGFSMDAAQALAQVITQDDFDNANRTDGNGPQTWPMAHFTASAASGWGYYWIAVKEGRGEPPGGVSSSGVPQGTGLAENGTTGFTDVGETGDALEFWIWPTALNVTLVGDGSRTIALLGYPE